MFKTIKILSKSPNQDQIRNKENKKIGLQKVKCERCNEIFHRKYFDSIDYEEPIPINMYKDGIKFGKGVAKELKLGLP